MTVEFAHPYAAPTLTLELRNPNLGDAEQLSVFTRFKKAMDGTVVTHKSTPTTIKLLLTFTRIVKAKVDSLISFIDISMGDEIKYTDHNAVIWRGYILSDPVEITTEGRKDGTCIEVSTVTVEFQGSIVP